MGTIIFDVNYFIVKNLKNNNAYVIRSNVRWQTRVTNKQNTFSWLVAQKFYLMIKKVIFVESNFLGL